MNRATAMEQTDLFRAPAAVCQQDRILLAAHRLAVYFTEEDELPARYRKRKPARPRKIKEDAVLEKRFRANVKSWTELIETMLSKIDNRQAWRFIDLAPEVPATARKLVDCKDFCDFVDYLILRRDKEEACPEEVGGLAWLLMPFQRKIEERLQTLLSYA
jgi:hypothetical protein